MYITQTRCSQISTSDRAGAVRNRRKGLTHLVEKDMFLGISSNLQRCCSRTVLDLKRGVENLRQLKLCLSVYDTLHATMDSHEFYSIRLTGAATFVTRTQTFVSILNVIRLIPSRGSRVACESGVPPIEVQDV